MKDGRTLGRAAVGEATRRAVVDQLLAASEAGEPVSRVLTLDGPAQTGKTTAVLDFAAKMGGAAFVVAVSEPGTGVASLIGLLTQSIGVLARGAQLSFNAMYGDLHDPSSIRRIVDWFRAHIDADVWIAIDNVELLDGGDDMRELLDGLVRECASVRWMFAGRTLAVLPIDAWRASGMAVTSVAVNGAEAPSLARMLERLDENQMEVLASLAPLRVLEPRIVHAMLGDAGTLTVRSLQRSFPALFDGDRPPALHRDVRAALIDSLRDRSTGALDVAIERCAAALETHEYYDDLLHLYMRLGARAALASLIARRGLLLAGDINIDTLEAALTFVGGRESPGVLSLHAVLASRRGSWDVAERLFTRALTTAHQPLASQIAYAFGCDLLRRNRAECETIFERLLDESPTGGVHQSEVRSALAQAYVLTKRFAGALEQIKFALHVLPQSGPMEATVKARAAYVYFYAAENLGLAERFASDALAQALELRAYTVAVGAASILYNVACERDRPREALAALELLADCAIKLGNVAFQSYAVIAMLECHVEAGDRRAIAQTIETLCSFEIDGASLVATEALAPAEAMQCAWNGDFERAYEVLQPTAARAHDDDYRMLREAELAFYAAGAGLTERARAHAARSRDAMTLVRINSHKRVRASILLALASSVLGDAGPAESLFAATLEPAAQYSRLAAIRDGAYLVHRARQGNLFATHLEDAFARMRERGAGGLALCFAVLTDAYRAGAQSEAALRGLRPGTNPA